MQKIVTTKYPLLKKGQLIRLEVRLKAKKITKIRYFKIFYSEAEVKRYLTMQNKNKIVSFKLFN